MTLAVVVGAINVVGLYGLAVVSLFTISHAEGSATYESVTASGALLSFLFGRLPSVLVYSALIAGVTLLLSNISTAPRSTVRRIAAVQFGACIVISVALRFLSLL
ncbi:hypothetical protein [Rubricoccus marinus]|uniref:hypothetical protein n=1 Tax=Rubricoccus marinus TaxID=716817 RepID=UPI001179C8C3|nr:hypothetical protein [Rubricoccus marinus]